MTESVAPKRQMTFWDCLGIGINGIIGVGIFFSTAKIWRQAGGQAPWAWLITGIFCSLVALCFAEAASRTDRSGGPYRYAHQAFGPSFGFAVGWVILLSVILGYSAVAKGFSELLFDLFWPLPQGAPPDTVREIIWGSLHISRSLFTTSVGILLVVFLGIINMIGVEFGAKTSFFISLVKTIGLLLFIGVGLFLIKGNVFSAIPNPAPDPKNHHILEPVGILAASFSTLFSMTGVEYVSVPAGEVKNPKRTVPWALALSVICVMTLYILIQIVAGGSGAILGGSQANLEQNAVVDAARALGGNKGFLFMSYVCLLSGFGYCTGSAFIGPRFLEAFAQDGFLPKSFAVRHQKRGTPILAIIVVTLFTAMFLPFGGFSDLAELSNIAVVIQYSCTCIAILVLRKKAPLPDGAFQIPGGPIIPTITLAGCGLFLYVIPWKEWLIGGGLIILGFVVGLLFRFLKKTNQSSPIV